MAKAAAPSAPNVTATPVTEVSGGGNSTKEVLAGKTERWNDTDDAPALAGPVEVVEMDGGLGEQSKAEQIMMALRGDGSTEEYTLAPLKTEKVGEEKPTPEAKVEAKAEEEKPAPTRRDLLANISAEKKARQLEAQLAEERAKVKQLTEGTIADAMKARGLTREQAMERLVLEQAAPVQVDPDPERTALRARVDELSRVAARAEDAEVAKVVAENIADVDVPLVKAAKRIPVPQDDGTAVYKTTHNLIAELCEQLWIDEGKPSEAEKPRRSYIPTAAKLLEQALLEDPDLAPLLTARAAKAEPKAPATKAPVPAVGKRGGPPRAAASNDSYAGLDDYSRRLAIKRDFGV